MKAFIADIRERFYNLEQIVFQFESQDEVCKQHGFFYALERSGVIDRTKQIINEKWLHTVYKQFGDFMVPGTSVMEGVKIEEAYFTNESAKELIYWLTYVLYDFLHDPPSK